MTKKCLLYLKIWMLWKTILTILGIERMNIIEITYKNREEIFTKELIIGEWVDETPESLQKFIESLNSLMDLLEVLKMNVIDMKEYKERLLVTEERE